MKKYIVILTDKEIMEFIGKEKSTFNYWKKHRPKEYELVHEALIKRKFEELLQNSFKKQ